ncbi:MAG: C39 family peptidase [Candidatus Galacturonibacter soehngenii]|nr:C39 family peptidase [Candidatus Galacturonibacter soehngenii]
MNPAFVKVAAVAAKNPKKTSKFVMYVLVVLFIVCILVSGLTMSVITCFTGEGAINLDFNAIETDMYKDISSVYEEFMVKVQDRMNEKKEKIIRENTKTVTKTEVYINDEGKLRTREVTETIVPDVVIELNYINHAYVYAYLNVTDDVLRLKKFKLKPKKKKKILSFYETITDIEVTKTGENSYLIKNVYMTKDEIANYYFSGLENSSNNQMYLLSFQMYEDFFGVNSEESGLEDGTKTDTNGNIENKDDSELVDGEMNIPLYLQGDSRWGKKSYGTSTISKAGCAPTAIAMVLSYLRGESITPDDVVNFTGNRYYVTNQGSSWSIFPACASHWQVNCKDLGKSENELINELRAGHPVIASMGPGTFTSGGHLIVLRGITSDGKILVNDPNDNSRKSHYTKKFDLSLIMGEAKNFWSFY